MNKMPLGNVDINLTGQTPMSTNRIRQIIMDEPGNSFEKKLVTPTLEKSLIMEKVGSKRGKTRLYSNPRSLRLQERGLWDHVSVLEGLYYSGFA